MNSTQETSGAPLPAGKQAIDAAAEPAEATIQILRSPAHYVRDRHGAQALDRLARVCGLQASDFADRKKWISIRQVSHFLGLLHELVGDDNEFIEANTYAQGKSYGGLNFVLFATSPKAVLKLVARFLHLLSSAVALQVTEDEGNRLRLRFMTKRPEHETRLMCLSRRAVLANVSRLWNLPAPTLKEHACIAEGDEACDYEFSFYEPAGWLFPLLGAGGGMLGASGAAAVGLAGPLTWFTLPALGAVGAYAREARRTYRDNLALSHEAADALRQVAEGEATARKQAHQLSERQREWGRVLEEQLAERTDAAQKMMDDAREWKEQRTATMREFSHDLRNPMSIMRSTVSFLTRSQELDPEAEDILEDVSDSIDTMDRMLTEMMESQIEDSSALKIAPEPIYITDLVEKLRRRLHAFTMGKALRTTAVKAREAPEKIHLDPVMLDRILDNLLTNAAKYTDHGSVIVEVDGSPEHVVLKIVDTGRGMSPAELDQVFRPGGSSLEKRANNSYGVGLSAVVRVIAVLGGKLEVMSRLDGGTTFWVRLPLEPEAPEDASEAESKPRIAGMDVPEDRKTTAATAPIEQLIGDIVTIRRLDPVA